MVSIFITLIVVGVLLYLLNAFLPMDSKIKTIINILAVALVIIWLVKVLGLMKYLNF